MLSLGRRNLARLPIRNHFCRLPPPNSIKNRGRDIDAVFPIALHQDLRNNRRNYRKNLKEPDENEKKSTVMKRLGVLTGIGSLILAKGKYVLVGLKLTKATPLVSMVLSSAAYSMFFGWPYAVGMVGQMFVHECGHAIVMRHYGVKMSPMVFIPFMGAAIIMKSSPESVEHEAYIALGGPVLGTAAALAISGVAAMNHSQLLYALADFGLMINLFNLLPIGSLDGGKIAGAISPMISVAGLGLGGVMIYHGMIQNPIFYFIMLTGTYSTGRKLLGYDDQKPGYYQINFETKGKITAAYVGLIALLLYSMKENAKRRKTPRQLKAEREGIFLPEEVYRHDGGRYDDFFEDSDDQWRV
mmetsp:Transcript_4794/g.7252  ORF Transcript_4794/g.7252 Transcript_4794/m.7252 type:complete len:356 (+) Transcript_4794:59-1126(+)